MQAFNEVMEIDFRRLWQWLKRFGIDSCGFSMDEKGDLAIEKRYHASGEDIAWAIEQIDPDCIVTIHTEARDWFARSFHRRFDLSIEPYQIMFCRFDCRPQCGDTPVIFARV